MAIEVRAMIEPLRSLAFGSIAAGYTAIGTALDYPARLILMQNYTDAQVMFSIDGTTDHITLNAGESFIWDISANKTIDDGFFLAKEITFYVKQVGVPSSGNVYISSFYGDK